MAAIEAITELVLILLKIIYLTPHDTSPQEGLEITVVRTQGNHSPALSAGFTRAAWCSPELSPDKMLNADLKQAVTTQAPARTKRQLLKATTRHIRKLQKPPSRGKSYFEHAPVKYAA